MYINSVTNFHKCDILVKSGYPVEFAAIGERGVMKTKIVGFALLLSLASILGACGGETAPSGGGATPGAGEPADTGSPAATPPAGGAAPEATPPAGAAPDAKPTKSP